jgi:hypothetical protein
MCPSLGADASSKGLTVYRLVDKEHDPVGVGKRLTRISDCSNQKYGPAMYFAFTREDALNFAKAQRAKGEHGHKYTHLLTCRIEHASSEEFVDLRATPNVMMSGRFRNLPTSKKAPAYCKEHGKKGVIWQSQAGLISPEWTELCLYQEHVGKDVVIVAAEDLAC